MSDKTQNKDTSEQRLKARRRFLGAGAGLIGLTAASNAQAGFFAWCFPKNGPPAPPTHRPSPPPHAGGPDPIPCFLKDTKILTRSGQVAVQDLKVGDQVMTVSGELKPIKWIGVTEQSFERGEMVPNTVRPIRIAKNAIADGAPHADLLVSPDHAMFIDGVLIPAKYLVNGVTITQEPATGWDAIDYYHVELEAHDVIIAEGAAAETYRAYANRHGFDNGVATVEAIAPAFAPVLTMARREMILSDIKSVVMPWGYRPGKIGQIRNKLADRADRLTGQDQVAA
ncbi:MAG: Hint domain-containing protein [Pseudomonadota bacterium]